MPSDHYPAPTWTACGDGCRWTADRYSSMWFFDRPTWGTHDADTIYAMVMVPPFDRWIEEVLDVTHGQPLVSVQTRNSAVDGFAQCSEIFGSLGPTAVYSWWHWAGDLPDPQFNEVFFAEARYRDTSTLDVISGSHVMSELELSQVISTPTRWGHLDEHDKSAFHVSSAPGELPPYPAVAGSTTEFGEDLASWGETFVWHESRDAPGRLHAYVPGAGHEVLAERDKHIMASTISEDGVVWLEANETPAKDAYFDADLWWVPDPSAPAPKPVALGLGDIPLAVEAGGGLAAALVCTYPKGSAPVCPLYVVKLATGQTWKLDAPGPGTYWTPPGAINAKGLVIGESDKSYFDSGEPLRIFSLDTTQLDALVATFAAKP